jgi:predicted peptidase
MLDERKITQHTFSHGSRKVNYNLINPDSVDIKGLYPLLVFLHGAGERGSDNKSQLVHGKSLMLTAAQEYQSFVLAPQCPGDDYWVEVDGGADKLKLLYAPSQSLVAVMDMLAHFVENRPVDLTRLYIMGISMGGFGTWSLLQMYPKAFAAAIPICGGGDPHSADLLVDTPIWAFHGAEDSVVPVTYSRQIVDAIEKAGGRPKYTEYPGVAHDSWTSTFNEPDLLSWLYSQKNNTPEPLPIL